MPRYQEPRVSSRDRKAALLASMQENEQRQQQLDAQGQSQMLQQLQMLYGLGQDAQMAPEKLRALQAANAAQEFGLQEAQQFSPEKLRALQAENTAREFQNSWAQPEAELKYRLGSAQAGVLENSPTKGQISMDDIMKYQMTTGQPLPPELLSAAPPEYRAFFEKQAADKEAQRQAALAADQAQQIGVPPKQPDLMTRAAGFGGGVGGGLTTWLIKQLTRNPAYDAGY